MVAAVSGLQVGLLVFGCALLLFVAARLLGDALRWWAWVTREEGDLE